ncbi:MAG TPA: cytochrome c oxidase assembly protein [Pseudolysinimonas sp.]|nr:cytochrome c oxidase assembly protein [Pseudolysinimonas sp.]
MVKLVRVLGPAALLAVAFAALVGALAFGGGANPTLIDPGALVRWGLPVAQLLMNLGVAVTIGALALAVFALSDQQPEYGRALDIAAAGAAVWAIAGGIAAMLTFSNLANIPFALDDSYGQVLGQYLTANEIGRAWLTTVLLGAVITVLCFAVRNQTLVALVGILSILAVLPLAEQGHAGNRASHDIAITAIFLHIAAASAWLGGLVTVVLLRGQLDTVGPRARTSRLARVLPRYSTLALLAFIVVAASGYVSAAVRIGDLPSVLSPYGILVLVKVAALGALGLFGVFYRRILIDRIVSGGAARLFWLLAVGELAFMGLASGVAAALARTATPVDLATAADQPDATPAYILTDAPLPPELNATTWFTQWNLDLLWLLVAGFAIIFYLAGVRRLRRRGDRWPWYRAVLWIAGMLLLIWVTNGPINVYEKYLFSIHMLGHMLLGMAIPVLLVLSAPVTLALRTVRKRDDGSRGVREWILLAVHSKVAAVVTHPLVVAVLFAGSLWVFYYTSLFRWATTDHVGHTWMIIHFLITGYLFAQTLVGIDPIPNQPPFPLRLVLLLATMAAHAFFGLSFVTGTTLLLPDWFGAMGRTWGPTPLADQQAGGGIAWSVGEIPTVILAITVALLWSRSDARDARRSDRAADRDGDAELRAYNEMLARQAAERR